ncbi:amidohydrolase family protein [Haloarchaeobius sp. TZWSO28]|uniref:amidohydrolase family protein n=1 Tax=Haloarchaeobius sp. TZWSO28 TaxID=3446119 RepID=UPI003EC001CE
MKDIVIDSHFHLWTTDTSTPGKRAERAEMIRREAEALGLERVALMPDLGETPAECRENNRAVAQICEEHPDLFYGWAVVDPRHGEAAVEELRRAVSEDGLVGLKHHCKWSKQPVSDPLLDPLAAALAELNAPLITHTTHRLPAFREAMNRPWETQDEDVVELAERFPDLQIIAAHVGAGGDWQRRVKVLAEAGLDNVYLDTSGSNSEWGQLEFAVDRLGAEHIVFGTDTWLLPGVGKLTGCDLEPEVKAEIAYKFAELAGPDALGSPSADEIESGKRAAVERFRAGEEPLSEPLVDANAFLGEWPFQEFDGLDAPGLVDRMDGEGIDTALVSASEAAFFRNVHDANRRLRDRVSGHEDRLVPVATIDPTYPEWEPDLREAVEEWGFQAVKLLPLYHDYDPDDEAAVACLEVCVELDVPVILTAAVEDNRKRHPRVRLRGHDELGNQSWSDRQADAIADLLTAVPEADVILADMWTAAYDVAEAVCESQPAGVRLDNFVREGVTLFVLGDLYMFFTYQGEEIVDRIGADHLAFGPQLPFKYVDSYHNYLDNLPVTDEARERIGASNVLELLGER